MESNNTSIRFISSSLVEAPNSQRQQHLNQRIQLTPWDLQFLPYGAIQKGLIFHNPPQTLKTLNLVLHLKSSLSHALHFFPPLAGRLTTDIHADDSTTFYIDCNNAGALFVHAAADGVTVADVTQPVVPKVVHCFFPLNGVKSFEGTRNPPLAVQVTELDDGLFIGCSINHSVGDGTSFWDFFNSWSEISRGGAGVSRSPSFQRWSPSGCDLPVRIPGSLVREFKAGSSQPPAAVSERFFHFSRDKIVKLKEKSSSEIGNTKISSLQAVLTHVWLCSVRISKLNPETETALIFAVGARPRLPLPDNYFGNAVEFVSGLKMKAGELLANGIGTAAMKMNNLVRDYSEQNKLVEYFRSWAESPRFPVPGTFNKLFLMYASSSPRFDVYGSDFGWGMPVAVRSGGSNKSSGKLTVFCGREEGSIDVELCLDAETLESLASDQNFLEFATSGT